MAKNSYHNWKIGQKRQEKKSRKRTQPATGDLHTHGASHVRSSERACAHVITLWTVQQPTRPTNQPPIHPSVHPSIHPTNQLIPSGSRVRTLVRVHVHVCELAHSVRVSPSSTVLLGDELVVVDRPKPPINGLNSHAIRRPSVPVDLIYLIVSSIQETQRHPRPN